VVMGQPPLEVVRNLAVVYYGLFALVSYVLIVRAAGSDFYRYTLAELLPRAAPWILGFATLTVIGGVFFGAYLPQFPKTDSVTVLFYKPTDSVMPLVVLMALWMRGYLKTRWMIWTAGLLAIAAGRSRSAMLAVGVALLAMIRKPTRRMVNLLAAGAAIFIIMLIFDVRIDLGYREVSARQFMANISSVIGSDDAASDLDATTTRNKDWRAAWWDAIYTDAVEHDRYLIGLGWGNNLADEFGFQTEDSDINALRNPHNAFLGILARGGWLAASLWIGFYLLLLYGLWQAARTFHDDQARQDMAWTILIYVLASQINGATDVFLESPQNAIPHWLIIGVGWALIRDAQLVNRQAAVESAPGSHENGPVPGGARARRASGLGVPLTPMLADKLRAVRPCPALALKSDRSTCGMSPRNDHICLHARGAQARIGWQRLYCLGNYTACEHWQASQAATVDRDKRERAAV